MKGGYISCDSSLKEGYDSNSDKDDEFDVRVPPKTPSSELVKCPICNKVFSSNDHFMCHFTDFCCKCGGKLTKTHKDWREEAGPSVEPPKPLKLFTDPLELTIAPPAPPPPPSLSLSLENGNHYVRFWHQQQQQLRSGNGVEANEDGAGLDDDECDKKFKP